MLMTMMIVLNKQIYFNFDVASFESTEYGLEA